MRRTLSALVTGLVIATGGVACSTSSGSSAPASSAASHETNPPGDIPDSQVFVSWSPPGGGYTVKVPEGWARQQHGHATVFTDKFNSVQVEKSSAATPPTVNSVRSVDLPALQRASSHFTLGKVGTVQRSGGKAVLITYRTDSAADPVTGKHVRQQVERYVFWKNGSRVVLTLSGAVGADNVDPWHTVTDSFRWS
ncbi:hypothetical protein OHS81_34255 [Streptomyces sp. NBC_00400]|uniref:hypothetical protein n=1 Tax=Streptomyces sp. NBC_00400 TaxID=2975737 RepID=UPI002E242AD0